MFALQHGKAAPFGGTFSPEDVAYRVVADHLRSITVTLADGLRPSSRGLG